MYWVHVYWYCLRSCNFTCFRGVVVDDIEPSPVVTLCMPEPNYVVIVRPIEVLRAVQTSLNNHGLGIGFLCVIAEYLREKV